MRLVVRVARITAHRWEYGQRFARAVAELVRDGHSLAVIQGKSPSFQPSPPANTNGNGSHWDHSKEAELVAIERETRLLISLLAKEKVIGIGLRATDAGLIQLRKQDFASGAAGTRLEAAHLHSPWLEIICANKGVPVISNLSCWLGGEDHFIDPDQMAAVCAVDWNADALIYITKEDGVPDAQGGILRWFDINSNGSQGAVLSDEMQARLQQCAVALNHGVWRVRILPLSNVDCLSSFYFASIKCGTEVIAGGRPMKNLVAPNLNPL
jgi:acetylglutamate kinase